MQPARVLPVRLLIAALLSLTPSAPAAAQALLTIDKTVTVISDLLGLARPRILPGSILDYMLMVRNPNTLTPARQVVITDDVPDTVKLRVLDLAGTGKGPVEFVDGGLLGTGLTNSGLTYSYAGLASTTDGLDFYDGTRWGYIPVADAAGYDRKVRGVRVTFGNSHAPLASFRLRYRVELL